MLVAEVGNARLRVAFRAAAPLTLHGRNCWRTDGNSPVRISGDRATVFFSSYEPQGHTLRWVGRSDLTFDQPPIPVKLHDDPDPRIGKWIEAIWQQPGGPLHGWYHAEEPGPGAGTPFVPHIGHLLSEDGGSTWRCCGDVLRLPKAAADSSWQNRFIAGGCGDLSVVPDRAGDALYLFFTSYHPEESAQGICVLSLRANDPALPALIWTEKGWSTDFATPPKPLWPIARGWRHRDPDSFWGPAVHHNRSLDAYVMLLNRTAGGAGNFLQEGIYASFNRNLADVAGWSPPMRIVHGGGWYPQAVGLEDGCGDTEVGKVGRFFMAGFSAWEIEFSAGDAAAAPALALTCAKQEFAHWFGADRRCPW